MTERDIPVTEDELHAHVDGELPVERRAAVEAWLAIHPDDAERVRAWRAFGDEVRRRYGGVVDEQVPPRLDLDRLRRPRAAIRDAVAAALVAFVLGGGTGWLAHNVVATETTASQLLRDDAVVAHQLYTKEVRHPIEVGGGEEHLLPWLSRRVGTALHAPDLTQFGLKLLGGRLLPGPSAPAALFMYESPSGERVTLYCTPLKGPTTDMSYKERDNAGSVMWTQADFGWVISGPADRGKLKSVAAAAYAQLENG